jgi:hypothetical protein
MMDAYHTMLCDFINLIPISNPEREAILRPLEEHLTQLIFNRTLLPSNPPARRKVAEYMIRNTLGLKRVFKVSKPNRIHNQCYDNAFKEFQETGNEMAYGLVDGQGFSNDNAVIFVVHAFNYDSKTGKYYDTTPRHEREGEYVPAYIMDVLPIFRFFPTPNLGDIIWGYVFITQGDRTFVMKGRKHGDFMNDQYEVFQEKQYVETI